MQNETDKGLTAKGLHSDPISWVEKYADYLYGFAMSRLRDEDVAKDLVQDTFLAGLQRLDRFEGNSEEKTWLTAILKNKIADFYRKQSANGLRDLKLTDAEGELRESFDTESGHWNEKYRPQAFGLEVGNPLLVKELGGILNECLAKLPGLWFSVFSMKHMDDLTSEMICTELKLTAANFWVIMHRTKLNLRACLQKTGTDMTSALKNIIYNCKQATFLIEKRIAGKITAAEKLQLHVHLRGCSVCKIYQQQSILINKVFVGFENSDFKLDETFKKTLKDKIEKEMNKN